MTAFGLTKQQWRTLKRALPQLETGRGQAACLGPAAFLATGVAKLVAGTLQMPLSRLTPLSDTLFAVCASASWPQLERSHLALSFEPPGVELIGSDSLLGKSHLSLCLELRPIIAALREKLLEVDIDDQGHLTFPPLVAAAR